MPIYEFRCLGCGQLFEILLMPGDSEVSLSCPHCGMEGGERVMSVAWSSSGGSPSSGPDTVSRSCPSGSCSTFTLPGHTK